MVTGMDAVRASYDTVARRYADEIAGELAGKPVDRALYALFADLVGAGAPVGDVGCGPGHVSAYLAGLGLRPHAGGPVAGHGRRGPGTVPGPGLLGGQLRGATGRGLGRRGRAVLGHPCRGGRATGRVAQPGAGDPAGRLLVAFHVEAPDQPAGSTKHTTTWWEFDVDLDFHFLDPDLVTRELAGAGFDLVARTDREPWPEVEYPSRRCYLLARLRTVVQ
jgi:hypothetical protein